MTSIKKLFILFLLSVGFRTSAQSFIQYTTTEQQPWQTKGKVSLSTRAKAQERFKIQVPGSDSGREFRAWGTCFN